MKRDNKKEKSKMLEAVTRYINRLSRPATGKPPFSDDEIAEAIASLFKQMVIADGVVRKEEVAAAMRGLVSNYGYLDTDETTPSITERFSNAKSETVFSIATVLNRSLTRTQLAELKLQLVSVAMSDREFHENEQDFMQLIEKLITD